MRAVNNGGRMVGVGHTSGPMVEMDWRDVCEQQLSLIGRMMGHDNDDRTVMGLSCQGRRNPVPELLTDPELVALYETIWQARQLTHLVMLKLLLFTGIRNAELVRLCLTDV